MLQGNRFWHPGDEGGLAWNDPDIGIEWLITPDKKVILSKKDKHYPEFKDIFKF